MHPTVLKLKTIKSCNCNYSKFLKSPEEIIVCTCILQKELGNCNSHANLSGRPLKSCNCSSLNALKIEISCVNKVVIHYATKFQVWSVKSSSMVQLQDRVEPIGCTPEGSYDNTGFWERFWEGSGEGFGLSGTKIASQNRNDHGARKRARSHSAAEIAGFFASLAAKKSLAASDFGG